MKRIFRNDLEKVVITGIVMAFAILGSIKNDGTVHTSHGQAQSSLIMAETVAASQFDVYSAISPIKSTYSARGPLQSPTGVSTLEKNDEEPHSLFKKKKLGLAILFMSMVAEKR